MSDKQREENTGVRKVDEVREEALPLDARLLSDAVIELNISRRNVALYPPGHARITSAIERAYGNLKKLFEMRTSIFLGISKDSLVIDDKALDSRNPVFRECARSFHNLGVAGITFQAGVEREELVRLHELMTMQDPPTGKAFVDAAGDRGIKHLRLNPIDYSSFKFREDELRGSGKGGGKDLWEDYVYGVMHGNLAVGDAAGVILKAPPEELAEFIEETRKREEDLDEEAYDRVVASYLSSRGDMRVSARSMEKLVSLMDNLSDDTRAQFLDRTMEAAARDMRQIEDVLGDMTSADLGKVIRFFTENSSHIPQSFKNLIDRFTDMAGEKAFVFDITAGEKSLVHDIEIEEEMSELFREDRYREFVSDEFSAELERMASSKASVAEMGIRELETECRDDVIDRVTSDILLEFLNLREMETGEFMGILTTLTKMAGDFVDTGRFEEALNIYTAVRSHSFTGSFSQAASGTVEYFFQGEPFLQRVLTAVRLWGRTNREGAFRVIRALGQHLALPLLDALMEEESASQRKFLLTALVDLGSGIMPGVIERLRDERWYVTRNMLILARRCGSPEHEQHVRKFVKHADRRVWSEAMRALFVYKSKYAIAHLKAHLGSEDPDDREIALRIAAAHRVKEAAPMLIEFLGKKDVLGAGAYDKTAVVRALGEIGDPEAIPLLDKLLHTKTLLFKGSHEQLRLEIYRSLGGYPLEDMRYLCEEGLSSGNPEIAEACKQVLRAAKAKRKNV